jgi:hypothetical protein
MGTVVNLMISHSRDDVREADAHSRKSRATSRRDQRGPARWAPDEAARAWWEMTLIKSTLEALCELSQQALRDFTEESCSPARDLQSAFAELRTAAEQVGTVCQDEVQALLMGETESLTFASETEDPAHIRVISDGKSISSITPTYRQLHLGNPEMARLSVQVLEGAVARFAHAIAALSMSVGADGPLACGGEAAQFARDTAALTRLQILAQADKALCSQAGAIPARVYSLLNHQ